MRPQRTLGYSKFTVANGETTKGRSLRFHARAVLLLFTCALLTSLLSFAFKLRARGLFQVLHIGLRS